jgi:hypothetical protein
VNLGENSEKVYGPAMKFTPILNTKCILQKCSYVITLLPREALLFLESIGVYVGVLDRQTYQGGTRGSRLCGEGRDRETESSKVCARTQDTRFIQVQAAKVANPTSYLGIKYGTLRLVLG